MLLVAFGLALPPTPAAELDLSVPMATPRSRHAAVPLADGRVLILGGVAADGTLAAIPEIFDPRLGTTTALAADGMGTAARADATATVLFDGRVFVAGGVDAAGAAMATTRLFDPRAAAGARWSAGPTMAVGRVHHTATRLDDGSVLIIGGAGCSPAPCARSLAAALPSVQRYLPSDNSLEAPTTLPDGATRFGHATVHISGYGSDLRGEIRVFGGFSGVLDPASGSRTAHAATLKLIDGTWATCRALASARAFASATRLDDSRIALVGGTTDPATAAATVAMVEVFDPSNACGDEPLTTQAAIAGTSARHSHAASLLADGRLLVAGGWGASSTSAPLESVDILSLGGDGGGWTGAELAPNGAGAGTSSTILATGHVLLGGGELFPGGLRTLLGTLRRANLDRVAACTLAPLPAPLARGDAIGFGDGRLLVAFGEASGIATDRAYLFDATQGDPTSCGELLGGLWQAIPDSSGVARRGAPLVALADGSVLAVGGEDRDGAPLDSVRRLRDDGSGPIWRAASPLTTPRRNHSATGLGDGRVLACGGIGPSGPLASCEVYDPRTDRWATTLNTLPAPRSDHGALLLRGGTVLLVGGRDGTGTPLSSVLRFTPGNAPFKGTFAVVAALGTARANPVLAPLLVGAPADGLVLAAFGIGGGGTALASSEVYDPSGNTWTALATPVGFPARDGGARAAVFPQGPVLVVGGAASGEPQLAVFDPPRRTWETARLRPDGEPELPLAGPAVLPRHDGLLLVAGGLDNGSASITVRALDRFGLTLGSVRQPGIDPFGAWIEATLGQTIPVFGNHFASAAASGGNGAREGAATVPVAAMRRLTGAAGAGGATTWIAPTSFTDGELRVAFPSATLPGRYALRALSAGAPGREVPLLLVPPSSNGDGDGFVASLDCDDTNAAVWDIPPEVLPLTIAETVFLPPTTASWVAPVPAGSTTLGYDLVRTTNPADWLTVGGTTCLVSNGSALSATLADPAAGTVHYFLVRARNGCPGGLGSAGRNSSGAERRVRSCP